MPAAVVAVEPGSGRVLAANRAARELSGEDPVGRPAAAWLPVERCRDADGRPLAEEQLPAVRAARGERIRGAAVACDTPLGERTLRVSAETVDGVALVTCEDVTELRAAQLGERLVGDDLRSIIEGIADAVTAQGPDGSLVYANDAAVRVLGFPSAEALLSAPMSEIMARWELLTPTGEPQSLIVAPRPPGADGRGARADARAVPRARRRGDALVAHQGAAGARCSTGPCGSPST